MAPTTIRPRVYSLVLATACMSFTPRCYPTQGSTCTEASWKSLKSTSLRGERGVYTNREVLWWCWDAEPVRGYGWSRMWMGRTDCFKGEDLCLRESYWNQRTKMPNLDMSIFWKNICFVINEHECDLFWKLIWFLHFPIAAFFVNNIYPVCFKYL